MRSTLWIFISFFIAFSPIAEAKKLAFLTPYAALLNAHTITIIKDGYTLTGIDYKSWQQDPKHQEAMNLLTQDVPSTYTQREQKISFWINAYNLLVIDLIISNAPDISIQHIGGIVGDPWNIYSWKIGGDTYSLEQIHQEQLRPLKEPRIHFALTCGAISCPPIKKTPYYAKKIYSQLEKQTAQYIASPQGTRLRDADRRNETRKQVYTSPIFKWYRVDFNRGKVADFLASYLDMNHAELADSLEFDWELNTDKKHLPLTKFKPTRVYYEANPI